jgi:hypothetical protein
MDKEISSIDSLPEKQEFVLEIKNKKPGWFIRFGGYFVIILVLILSMIIYIAFKKSGLL